MMVFFEMMINDDDKSDGNLQQWSQTPLKGTLTFGNKESIDHESKSSRAQR